MVKQLFVHACVHTCECHCCIHGSIWYLAKIILVSIFTVIIKTYDTHNQSRYLTVTLATVQGI